MHITGQDLLTDQAEAAQLEEIIKPGISPATMKGLVYRGPGIIELKIYPGPKLLNQQMQWLKC